MPQLIGMSRIMGAPQAGLRGLSTPSFMLFDKQAAAFSITPDYSAGSGTPTFTRATTATVTDWENVVRPVLSGEVRFQGARRVRNLVTGSSQDFSNAAWGKDFSGTGSVPVATANYSTAPDGTLTASRLQLDKGAGVGFSRTQQTVATVIGRTYAWSVWLKTNDGTTKSVGLRVGAANNVLVSVTPTWQRFSDVAVATSTGDNPQILLWDTMSTSQTADLSVWGGMDEDVTGQSNTNPSEYVSVGVLSAPYHGANVDGVKYFTTQNGNTVASNVVTEATGAAISSTTLLGYLAEGARTNLCLQSAAFDNASWVKTDTTPTADSIVAPDGTTTADLMTEGVAGTSLVAQAVTATANANYACSMWTKTGNITWLRAVIVNGANSVTKYFNIATGAVGTTVTAGTGASVSASITAYPNGWYRLTLVGSVGSAATAISWAFSSATADNNATRVNNATYYTWGAQFEDNVSFASSYIPTTTVAVTRNADVLTYAPSGNVLGAAGTAYAEISVEGASGTQAIVGTNNITGGVGTALYLSSATNAIINDGATVTTKSGLTDATVGVRKRASSWGSGLSVTGDGSATATGVFDGDLNIGAAVGIGVQTNGGNSLFGTIRNVRIWTTQPADSVLSAMTA